MLLKNKSLLASAVIAIFVASCAKETAVDSYDTSGDSYSEFVDSLESTGGKAYAEFMACTAGPDFNAENATKMICLLYTSPSPRDLSTSRMPSSA